MGSPNMDRANLSSVRKTLIRWVTAPSSEEQPITACHRNAEYDDWGTAEGSWQPLNFQKFKGLDWDLHLVRL